MTEQTSTSAASKRGTGFPSMALDDAVAVIKRAGSFGRSHTDSAFAGYLGHSSTNSGPFRAKMAALRDWGLIERPKAGQIPLTELGHQIAHPSGDERKLLGDAFFNARPFAAIYEESAKDTDLSLDLIANRAVTMLGVSPPSKARFVESFRRSVIAAGLGRENANGSIRFIPPGTEPEPAGDPRAEAGDSTASSSSRGAEASAAAPIEPGVSASRSASPVIRQEWPIAGGRVVFQVELDHALPGSAFGQVASVITAVEKFIPLLAPQVAGGEGEGDTPTESEIETGHLANAAD